MGRYDELNDAVESLQNLLISVATGGTGEGGEYKRLREGLMAEPATASGLPKFVRTCRDTSQFWQLIKYKFPSYAERRQFIWDEFRPLLDSLELRAKSPADTVVAETLKAFDPESVHELWQRAIERRVEDPEGALTLARTLLETVCKYILDQLSVSYEDSADLPKLYRLTAESLNIAPSQHSAPVFKQVLGGCTAVVEGLGSLRTKLGDAHGKGPRPVKPAPRHAHLAVNLAGTMATYLVETFRARQEEAGKADAS